MSFEDRGKYMSDVKGLSAYAMPIATGMPAALLDYRSFESCVLFQLGRRLAQLHTAPIVTWIHDSPTATAGGGATVHALANALHILESSGLSASIVVTLKSKLDAVRSFIESSTQLLPEVILHGSPTKECVWIDEAGNLESLNCWESACLGPALLDIASATLHWCVKKDGNIDTTKLRVMMMGYHTARQLSPHEIEMLPEAIDVAILARIIHALAADATDTTHLHQLRAMEDADASAAAVAAVTDLPKNERYLFTIPDSISYFDGCGMSPSLTQTVTIGQEAVAMKSTPWEPFGEEAHLAGVKESFAQIIRASPSDIALTPSTSYAISVAAKNIPLTKGGKVVVLEHQMASNVLPWQDACAKSGAKLSVIKRKKKKKQKNVGQSGSWTQAIIESLDDDVDVLAIPNCHWADGSFIDLVKVSRACRARDIKLVLDLTQSLGVIPIDVNEIQPAFLCASIHKWLLGPYGASIMYVAPEFQGLDAQPLEFHERTRHGGDDPNWDLVGIMSAEGYPQQSRPDASGLGSGGRPNPVLMPMLRSSIEQVASWHTVDEKGVMASKAAEWAHPAIQRVAACAQCLGLDVPHETAPHMIGIRIRDDDSRISDKLSTLRSLLSHMKSRGVYCALRVQAIRVGVGMWTSWDDVDNLCSALEEGLEMAVGANVRVRSWLSDAMAISPSLDNEKISTAASPVSGGGTDISKGNARKANGNAKTTQAHTEAKPSFWYDLFNF